MLIAVIADTHLPRGQRRLPDVCVERLRAADMIVHAGDFSSVDVMKELQTMGELVAVQGNVDDQQVRLALAKTATFQADGSTIAVVHDAGPRRGRLERLRRRFPEAHAVIFGHSHIPLHERAEDGFQIFNPGSPTERRRSPYHTMGLAHTDDGAIRFSLVKLD
jgi:putative phosphoesterase